MQIPPPKFREDGIAKKHIVRESPIGPSKEAVKGIRTIVRKKRVRPIHYELPPGYHTQYITVHHGDHPVSKACYSLHEEVAAWLMAWCGVTSYGIGQIDTSEGAEELDRTGDPASRAFGKMEGDDLPRRRSENTSRLPITASCKYHVIMICPK